MYFRKGDLKMKKSKLSLGLVTSFIGALALTACGTTTPAVTAKDGSILDFVGYNGSTDTITIDTNKFYSEYGDSDDGTTKFYNAILEALIRYEYKPLSEEKPNLRSYSAIEKEAREKTTAQRQVASDNAKSNGTTFDAEWDKILSSFNVKDENGLFQHFLYDLEKEAITDWYYKENSTTTLDPAQPEKNVYSLQDQYIGIDKNWELVNKSEQYDSVFPYHILHVLVKLDASADDYSRATLTAAQAKKLWLVVRQLIDAKYSFEDVAKNLSDDGSKDEYGDVGIMSKKTSFYNEFKLGIYAYDTLLSGMNVDKDTATTTDEKTVKGISTAFGLNYDATFEGTTTEDQTGTGGTGLVSLRKVVNEIDSQMVEGVQTAVTGYSKTSNFTAYEGIPMIPYDVFRMMANMADEEKVGNVAPESGDIAFPRNVLFNQFLNFRSPFIITSDDISLADGEDDKVTLTAHDFVTKKEKSEQTDKYLYIPNNHFVSGADKLAKYIPSVKDSGKGVLTDGQGNVIIGVRSTAGIHFMIMRKSIFKATNANREQVLAEIYGGPVQDVTLQDYYIAKEPGGDDYPTSTYVNMRKENDPSYYTKRVDTIKNKYKGADASDVYDAAYDYRIYEMLLNKLGNKVKFFDEKEGSTTTYVRSNIAQKIKLLREKQAYDNQKDINDKWAEYLAQLNHQNTMRALKGILPSVCAFKWNDESFANNYKKGEGAKCYVEK